MYRSRCPNIIGKRRILAKEYLDYELLPVQMNEPLLVACICGYDSVDSNNLMVAIVVNMPEYENQLCEKANNDELDSDEEEHFSELIDSYQCGFIPKKGCGKLALLDIASTRFLQSTKCVIDNVHNGC